MARTSWPCRLHRVMRVRGGGSVRPWTATPTVGGADGRSVVRACRRRQRHQPADPAPAAPRLGNELRLRYRPRRCTRAGRRRSSPRPYRHRHGHAGHERPAAGSGAQTATRRPGPARHAAFQHRRPARPRRTMLCSSVLPLLARTSTPRWRLCLAHSSVGSSSTVPPRGITEHTVEQIGGMFGVSRTSIYRALRDKPGQGKSAGRRTPAAAQKAAL